MGFRMMKVINGGRNLKIKLIIENNKKVLI